MKRSLSLEYKGNRNYIHGTDLFDHISQYVLNELKLTELENVTMAIHRMIRSQIKFQLITHPEPERPSNLAATFRFLVRDTQYICLLQEDGRSVSGRYPYDEDQVTDICNLDSDDKTISLVGKRPFTNIETVVAMNKYLLQTCFPEAGGKWLFTRVQLKTYGANEQWNKLRLKVIHNFQYRLIRSDIFNGGQLKGSIFFSVRSRKGTD
jgi:hypothetical protein